MAAHAETTRPANERVRLGERAWPLYRLAQLIGIFGLLGSVVLGYFAADNFRHFYFSYLASFAFFLTIALGALIFVLIQHLVRAAWSTPIRRIAESLAATLPVLGILSAPILISVWIQKGDLYRWALPMSAASQKSIEAAKAGEEDPEPAAEPQLLPEKAPLQDREAAQSDQPSGHRTLDSLMLQKRPFLNPTTYTVCVVFYFLVWSFFALWYRRQSTLQDIDGDVKHTVRMQAWAPLGVLFFALTITAASFHLVMSLDPHWFSTIFGVYFFAGGFVSCFASLILISYLLQRAGYLRQSVTIEHYHDMGKFLFAFTFFYGYISFAQYMLLWYANMPETSHWWADHGASMAQGHVVGWSWVLVAILFGHILIPFAGLLSRHVKRARGVLVFWAVWILVFHWIDMFWLIMAEMNPKQITFGLLEVAAFLGIGGVFIAAFVRYAANHSLRPLADPRLPEGLALQNM